MSPSNGVPDTPVGLTDLMRPFKRTEIARETGISVKRIHNIANGVVKPSVTELPLFAKVLRVSIDAIIAGVKVDEDRQHGGPRSVAV